MKVIDANAVIEFIAFDLDPARLGDDPLSAPHLLDTEVVHALRGLELGGRLTRRAAARALRTFEDMAIERHPAAPLRQRVWELRHNLTAYDATYVALTEMLTATSLLTKDARIARAPGIRCAVEVL